MFVKAKEFVNRQKYRLLASAGTAIVPVMVSVQCFAAETGGTVTDEDLAPVAITTDMLRPIVNAVSANIGVILPIGIILFGILLGVTLVPKVIKKFLS